MARGPRGRSAAASCGLRIGLLSLWLGQLLLPVAPLGSAHAAPEALLREAAEPASAAGRARAAILPPAACGAVFFGPARYTRSSRLNQKDVFLSSAVVPAGVNPPFRMQVENGSTAGRNRVRAARLYVNGVKAVEIGAGSADRIDAAVLLASRNLLTVAVEGRPGSFVTLRICRDGGTGGGGGAGPDGTPPVARWEEPPPGSTATDATPRLALTYQDAEVQGARTSGIDLSSVQISLDGTDRTALFSVGAPGATLAELPANLALDEGPHELRARIRDAAGNTAEAVSAFTVRTLGTITGRATSADGRAAVSTSVNLFDFQTRAYLGTAVTNAAGQFTFGGVEVGRTVELVAADPEFFFTQVSGPITVARPGETVQLNLVFLAVASLRVQASGPGPLPLAGLPVFVRSPADTGFFQFQGTLDASGQLVTGAIREGAFALQITSGFGGPVLAELGGRIDAAQHRAVVPFPVALDLVSVTIAGRVTAADGATPLANSRLQLRIAGTNDVIASRSVSPDGAYSFPDLVFPRGRELIVRADPPRVFSVFAEKPTGPLNTTGVTVPLDFALPVTYGTLEGRVFAADGATGAPTQFQIVDRGTGEFLGFFFTPDGAFELPDLFTSSDGFTVRASSGFPDTVSAEVSSAFATPGELRTVSLTLPLSVLQGRLTFANGNPPPLGSAFVFATGSDGSARTGFLDENGLYRVFGTPLGPIAITGQDSGSGLSVSAHAELTDIATPLTVDLRLPPAGTVTGRLLDSGGNPVQFGTISLSDDMGGFQRRTNPDASGRYVFNGLPLGPVLVHAQLFSGSEFVYASAAGELTSVDEPLILDLAPPPPGSVEGVVLEKDGVTPARRTGVSVESFGGAGPLGHFQHFTSTDSSGRYRADGVPSGLVRVSASSALEPGVVGLASGLLEAADTLSLDLTVGNTVTLQSGLSGSDGFLYDVQTDGALGNGGTADRRITNAYAVAYRLSAGAASFCCVDRASQELEGRQLVLGPLLVGQPLISRKIFVPASGGFARFLEIITNPTAEDLDVTIQVAGDLGSFERTRIVRSAPGFTVTDDGEPGAALVPALAHVFSGTGPIAVPAVAEFGPDGTSHFSYRWTTAVPAGGTVAFLHFAVQREPGDSAAAEAQALALQDLSDPAALFGLTAEERSAIQNFLIPQE